MKPLLAADATAWKRRDWDVNPGLSGSHVSAFLPRREIGEQRTHWETPGQNQRGELMGVSVLKHHAWRVSKRCSLPIPRSQCKDAGARETPESAGPWAWTSARCITGARHVFVGGEMERRTWTQGKLGRGEIGRVTWSVTLAHCWPGSDPTPPHPQEKPEQRRGHPPCSLPSELLDRGNTAWGWHRCVSLGERERKKRKHRKRKDFKREKGKYLKHQKNRHKQGPACGTIYLLMWT